MTAPYLRAVENTRTAVSTQDGHRVVGPVAYASDISWNVVAKNPGFDEMFLGAPPDNMFYWLAKHGAPQLPDHDSEWLGLLLPQLRALLARHSGHPELAQLRRWCEQTDGVADAWVRTRHRSYQTPDGDIRPFVHPEYGFGALELGCMAMPQGDDIDLRVFMVDFHIGVTPSDMRKRRFASMSSAAASRKESRL